MNVGVAAFRNRLSFYLREVRKGRNVVVMDHGRPIAQLIPFAEGQDDLATRIAELGQEGVVTAQPLRQRQELEPIALHRPHIRASRLVSRLRDDR